ncbi:hypothetical protein [Streptomyces sp. NPDC048106]|uniref:anti-sigma factor family protein n=1 Tax=Streptomyces sp. NPDC048106 TaxID=3155750 RepID=UPI003453F58E
MTSTTDTAGHPDVTEISDLAEGLLPPDRGMDVRRHLGACELCADVYASLEEIRGLLGSAQAPEPMPVDVAQRIDAALAAEALLTSSGSGSGSGEDSTGHVSRETSTPTGDGTATSADRPTDRPTDRPAGRPQAATGPGRKKDGRGRRRAVVLSGVLTAAILGAGALVLQSLSGGTSSMTAHDTPSASAGAFSGSSVQDQVRKLLTPKKSPQRGDSQQQRSGGGSEQNTPQSTESANTLLQPQVAVPECVRLAIPTGERALAAKPGTYDGKSAYLVVLSDPQDSTRVTAFVVDAACVGQQSVSAGKVLLKQPVARP